MSQRDPHTTNEQLRKQPVYRLIRFLLALTVIGFIVIGLYYVFGYFAQILGALDKSLAAVVLVAVITVLIAAQLIVNAIQRAAGRANKTLLAAKLHAYRKVLEALESGDLDRREYTGLQDLKNRLLLLGSEDVIRRFGDCLRHPGSNSNRIELINAMRQELGTGKESISSASLRCWDPQT